ncbi:uncharacterized protein LOC111132447 [Crassostrea virginica]
MTTLNKTKAASKTRSASSKDEQCSPNKVQNSVPLEVPLEVLDKLQKSIEGIGKKVHRLESLETELKEIKTSIEDPDSGFAQALKYVYEQAENDSDELYYVKSENVQLRRELGLLRATVINMDRRIKHMDSEITDLRSRSMRDNILIPNLENVPGERLEQLVPQLLRDHLNVNDVRFVRIHRNSVRGRINSNPVTITGKLVDPGKKNQILQAKKAKKQGARLPFFITAQEPASVVEERKRLYQITDFLKGQNIYAKVEKNRITIPNGGKYEEPIPKLEISDALQLDVSQVELLDNIEVVYTQPTKCKGSEIFATGRKVCTMSEISELYKKVNVDPNSVASDHRNLVYRFKDSDGKIQESYWDDGEHGVGRRLLQYMRVNKIINVGVVITRWSGGIHLGPYRFKIMEEHFQDIANLLDEK